MSYRYITEAQVEQAVDMAEAVDVMEEAFRQLAAGAAENVVRQRCRTEGAILHSMSAAAGYLGVVGWKQYVTTRTGAKFHVGISAAATGELLALLEADRLGQVRTGAVTGLATRYLADPGARQVGIFGCGWQAESQLEAIAAVHPLNRIVAYCRTPERRSAFAEKMSRRLQIEVVAAEHPGEAARGLPIVVTATTSREPVLRHEWLCEGTLVCAVGSNWLKKAEIEAETVAAADLVVCDSVAACQEEAGDFVPALQSGRFDWSQARELGEVVAGKVAGRRPESLVLFKSVGLALEDVALAHHLLDSWL